MILAVDFDGVIHDAAHPMPGRKLGPPMPGAVQALHKLERGNKVIVYTARAGSPIGVRMVKDWLAAYRLGNLDVTAYKPVADVYLDDRAIRFHDWPSALDAIAKVTHHG